MHTASAEDSARAQAALDALLDRANKPSDRFMQAAGAFARRHALDEASVVLGEPFSIAGIPYCLIHHGTRDPDNATVLIDFGQYALNDSAARAGLFRSLLEHNARTPAALRGYFGLLPGTEQVRYCICANLASAASDDKPNAIDLVVDSGAELIRRMAAELLAHAHGIDGAAGEGAVKCS